MRIALISAEFIGSAYAGGIGTYMRNAAAMLAERGHEVEVFTAGERNAASVASAGYRINTVACSTREAFPAAVAPIVVERHAAKPFDVGEGAELAAETAEVARRLRHLPLVLKLHTPAVLIKEIDRAAIPASAKARFMVGGVLRGRMPRPFWNYDRRNDYEYANLATADEITAPSHAMVKRLADIWDLDAASVAVVPNVFEPPRALLDIPADTNSRTVTFLGRIEFRKGVLSLIDIVPQVLRRVPGAKFRVIGRALPHPSRKVALDEMIRARLTRHRDSIEWIPGLSYAEVLRQYAQTDICLFPSLWENFPNVCLEAMAAARGVVASSSGGMAEMIRHGESGLLASPDDPAAFADAIVSLLQSPERRSAMGEAARAKVLSAYSAETIAPLQEASYARAIARAKARNTLVA